MAAGGLGEFSAVDLQKKLAGKAVFIRPTIGELEEGLSGNASPKDAETLFQLIYLTFTAPRPDPVVFDVIKTQLKTFLENRDQSPETVFSDTLRTTMQRDQPRFRPMTVDEIPEMDLEKSLAFYRDRFADASDFTFVFVGNLDLETTRAPRPPLPGLAAFARPQGDLAGLEGRPARGRREEDGREGRRAQEPDGHRLLRAVRNDAGNRIAIRAAGQVLETRLRKLLREKLSGTYDVGVQPSYSKIPREEFRVTIDLGADPARMDELTQAIFREIKRLKKKGPTAKEVEEVRLAESRDYETSSRQNGWWHVPARRALPDRRRPRRAGRHCPESLGLLTRKRSKRRPGRTSTRNATSVTLIRKTLGTSPTVTASGHLGQVRSVDIRGFIFALGRL